MLAEKHSNIKIITDFLSESELFGLIERSNCIVSTHRSEGFGYIPAYGYLLDRDVIVCDHSGFSEIADSDHFRRIDYRLVPVPNGKFFHESDHFSWAEINRLQLKDAMKQMYDAWKSNSDITLQKKQGLPFFTPNEHCLVYKDLLRSNNIGT